MQDMFHEAIHVCILSLGSLTVLFILTKIMGYKQMSQLNMFDYINGITIGSIAAEMATSLDDSFLEPLIAMVVYALAAVFLSYVSTKSIKARRLINGKPLVLLSAGVLYEKNLKRAKMDVSSFLVQCRESGFFDISKLELAILEENGMLSFLPKVAERSVNIGDLKLSGEQEFLVANVIIDGRVVYKNLKHSGKDETWLKRQLKGQGVKNIEDVFLATCDRKGVLRVFPRTEKALCKDVLV